MHRKALKLIIGIAWLYRAMGAAQAEIWRGCVEVANNTGIDVTATVEGYPGNWPVSSKPSSPSVNLDVLHINGQPVVMQADSHGRPPIHFQPSQVGMIWNFFTNNPGSSPVAAEPGCTAEWRIVVIKSPCDSVIDNLCQ
jgi:hypothetical protein